MLSPADKNWFVANLVENWWQKNLDESKQPKQPWLEFFNAAIKEYDTFSKLLTERGLKLTYVWHSTEELSPEHDFILTFENQKGEEQVVIAATWFGGGSEIY